LYHREGRVKDDETVLLNESLNILKGNCDLSGDFLSFSGEERRGSKSSKDTQASDAFGRRREMEESGRRNLEV